MKQMAESRQLLPTDMVLQEGGKRWGPASQVQVFFPPTNTPPPPTAPVAAELAEWQYIQNGQQYGPVSWSQIRKLVDSGELRPTDMVRESSMPKWATADSIQNLFPSHPVVPSPPPSPAPSEIPKDETKGSTDFWGSPMLHILFPFKFCWRSLRSALMALDNGLVLWATPFGVNIVESKKRYIRFLAIYAVIFILAFLPIPILPFVALTVGYVGVIAVGRAWVRNENKRTAIAKKLEEGKPDEMPDLRGIALVSALQLFLLFPILFRQFQNTFGLYAVHGEAGFLTWFWFALDKTYLKALPDWSILYRVHISSIDFDSPWGQHLVLFSRLTFDFILIQGIKRLYDIHQIVREGVAAVKNDTQMAVLLGKRAVGPLILALKNQERSAAEALGKLGDVRAVEPLILALKDQDQSVRASAAEALGKLGDVRAVEPLILTLQDQEHPVVEKAFEALGKLGDVRAFEPLILALKVPSVKILALKALGELGDVRAFEPLILALKDTSVKGSAIQALGELGDVRAVEPLILELKDPKLDGWNRMDVIQALGKLGDVRAVEPLILEFRGSHALFKAVAAEALNNWIAPIKPQEILAPQEIVASANAYLAKGDFDRAVSDARDCIRLDPNYAIGYGTRAEAYLCKNEFDLAIADATEAIRLDPNYAIAYGTRAEAYRCKNEFDLAIADATEAIQLNPYPGIAYGTRGSAFRVKGDFASAISDLTEAIRLVPGYEWGKNQLEMANQNQRYTQEIVASANAYLAKGEFDRAIADATEAIRLDPNYAIAYGARAEAYRCKNEFACAIADATEAIRLDPKYVWAYGTRGCAFRGEGDFASAIVDFTEALRLDPNYEWGKNQLEMANRNQKY